MSPPPDYATAEQIAAALSLRTDRFEPLPEADQREIVTRLLAAEASVLRASALARALRYAARNTPCTAAPRRKMPGREVCTCNGCCVWRTVREALAAAGEPLA